MATEKKSTFVLVHGAWCGGWIWRDVADLLRAQGHRVFTPTLTGLADKSHLVSDKINLSTHILDIVNLIKWEELTDITLVGHSYGGRVLSGVAEKVPEGTIKSIVYLDAVAFDDLLASAQQSDAPQPQPAELEGGVMALAPVPIAAFGYSGEEAERLASKRTPQPIATFMERSTLTGARERIPTKTFILAEKNGQPYLAQTTERLKGDSSWRVESLPCRHDAMIEMPAETAAALLRAAQG